MTYGTRVLQQFLSWAELIQFLVFTPIALRPILILSSHLYLDLPRGLFLIDVGLPRSKAVCKQLTLLEGGTNSRMRMKVQGRLMEEHFIEIH